MIQLLLHTCVSQVSLSNAHHLSERRDLDRTRSFRSFDVVHYIQARFEVLHRLHLNQMDLCFLAFGGSLGCSSATVFFPFCCCGSCLREPSCSSGDLDRSLTRFCGSTVAEFSSRSCEDECGGVRSRDLDLSSLLERPSVQLMVVVQLMVMRGSQLLCPHVMHHQVLE